MTPNPQINHQKEIRSIRRAANIGLYGTLALGLLTLVEHYLAEHVWARQIVTNDYTHQLLYIAAPVLTVVGISYILLMVRRQLPQVRQLDTVDEKLPHYRAVVRTVYAILLLVMFVCCAVVVITRENIVIMMMLLLFFMAVMNYPNMYKMKSDMGLLDDEMSDLFGDNYIRDHTSDDSNQSEES